MRTMLSTCIVFLVVIGTTLLSPRPIFLAAEIAPDERPENVVPPPVFKDGDFWHFKVTNQRAAGVSRSTGIRDGVYIVRYSAGSFQVAHLVMDEEQPTGRSQLLPMFGQGQSATVLGANATTLVSNDLQFPLFVGKEWKYIYKVGDVHAPQRNVHIRVVGFERIDTPVGVVDVVRIEKNVNWARASALRGTSVENVASVYFYSSKAKSIVKFNSSAEDGAKREAELIKFGSSN